MARIKVNWGELNSLGKKTIENRNTFETSRSRLQELVDELMNYWKGQDAENYHERATDFFNFLKGDTNHMERWGNYFGRASDNYKSGVEEGLKDIKQTNAELEEIIVNPQTALVSEDILSLTSDTHYGDVFTFSDVSSKSTGSFGEKTIDSVEASGSAHFGSSTSNSENIGTIDSFHGSASDYIGEKTIDSVESSGIAYFGDSTTNPKNGGND